MKGRIDMGNDDDDVKVSMKPLQHIYYIIAIAAAIISPWLWVHNELSAIKIDIATIKQQVKDHIEASPRQSVSFGQYPEMYDIK
jgi:hypothetical protein